MPKKKIAGGVFIGSKRIWRAGRSLALVIPIEFVRLHNLQHGDEVAVIAGADLRIIPIKEQITAA